MKTFSSNYNPGFTGDKIKNLESIFLVLIKSLKKVEARKKFPDSIFWFKDDSFILEYDEKKKYYWFSYSNFWAMFERMLGMDFLDISSALKKLVPKHFGYPVEKVNYIPDKLTLHITNEIKKGH